MTSTAADLSTAVRQGVISLLGDYAHLQATDKWVLLYSPDSRSAAAWVAVALRERSVEPTLVPMRPLVDPGLEARLANALPAPSAVRDRIVLVTFESDTMSHFEVLVRLLAPYEPSRTIVLRTINSSADFFEQALNVSPTRLTRLNATLLRHLMAERHIKVVSPGGTDLTVELDAEKYEWISNRGEWRPGGFTILPPGEIATFPADISGTLVADGAINCNTITDIDFRLEAQPVTVHLKSGEAQDFTCANSRIRDFVAESFERSNGRRVGELGFGTNQGITRFVAGNSHINERHPGVHLGFGQHNQMQDVVTYYTPFHLDMITCNATIQLSGGRAFDLATFSPESIDHPAAVRDEDIVGDCCGLGYREARLQAPRDQG